MDKSYEIFISSIEDNLVVERKEVLQGILECKCIPVGIEFSSLSNELEFEDIKYTIKESSCLLFVITEKSDVESIYRNDNSINIVEKELKYALEIKKPIIALIHEKFKDKFMELKEKKKTDFQIAEIFNKKVYDNLMLTIWSEKDSLKDIIIKQIKDAIKGMDSYKCIALTPQNIEETVIIADYLKQGDVFIKINLEKADVDDAQRIVDFVMGMVYMIEGSFQRIAEKIFIATPNGYEFYDDFEFLM